MPPTRRVFLEIIGAGTAATALHQSGCAPAPTDDRGGDGATSGSGGAGGSGGARPADAGTVATGQDDVPAFPLEDLPVGALLQVPAQDIAVGRDAAGVYALVLICTHQGCAISPSGSGASARIDCPCHGSGFDRNGAVVRGPAMRPLTHLSVGLDDFGNVVVHTRTTVDASARLAV